MKTGMTGQVSSMRLKMSDDKVQLFSFFIFFCLAGSFLLSLPFCYNNNNPVPYIDALFTAVSAVCVTGLASVNMSVFSTTGLIVIMVLIEFGGLGIISFIAFYMAVPKRKISLVNRSVIREFFVEDVETEPRKILKSILLLTLGIESAAAIILYFGFKHAGSGRPFLDALFHSIAAFCNAGFSTYSDNLVRFRSNPVILVTIMVLIVTGGIGFTVLTDINNSIIHRKKKMSFHSRVALLATLFLIVFSALLFLILDANYAMKGMTPGERILSSLFQAITPRTAGFESVPQKSYSHISKLITCILMFIGGSPGSIAGGVKTTTFMIVVIYAIRGNTERRGLNVQKRNIDTAVIEKSFSIVAKSMLIIILGVSLLLITEKDAIVSGTCSFFDLLFETVSAFATVGLSQSLTGQLNTMSKLVIILMMFFGRTGIFAMALGFSRNEKERFYEYPSANIMVG